MTHQAIMTLILGKRIFVFTKFKW